LVKPFSSAWLAFTTIVSLAAKEVDTHIPGTVFPTLVSVTLSTLTAEYASPSQGYGETVPPRWGRYLRGHSVCGNIKF
jgi:hypothetical protein